MGEIPYNLNGAQNPYVELTFNIPAGANQVFNFDFRTIRVLTLSSGSIKAQFGEQGNLTSVIGAGLGFEFDEAFKSVRIYSTHATDAAVGTLSLSMGKLQDNRLSISGAVTVQNVETAPLFTQEARPTGWSVGQVTVDTTAGGITIAAAAATRTSITIHAGTSDLYVHETAPTVAADSFKIPAGGSQTFTHKKAIKGIRSAGSTAASFSQETGV